MRALRNIAVVSALSFVSVGFAADPPADKAKPDTSAAAAQIRRLIEERQAAATAGELVEKGVAYLGATQDKDGGWAVEGGPGVTALVVKALIPVLGPDHPTVKRGVEFVLKFQRDDGGLYSGDGLLKNYESSVALSMLARLPGDAYADKIKGLQRFVTDGQWDEGEDISKDNVFYGGAGYGRHKRPDLSNTQMMVEALEDSGLSKDDPAYQKALVFIQRCQMRAESNDQPYAKGSTQGGFIYSPANGGETRAEALDVDGRTELKAYGAMTYAGLKSMLYAGLKKDDPRVQAAVDWIKSHWTLDANANMPGERSLEGLYYYYHTFGRALAAWGASSLESPDGKKHYWRHELVEALKKRQRPDGSWVNEADRYYEGMPALTTAYSVLALQAAYPKETMPKVAPTTQEKK